MVKLGEKQIRRKADWVWLWFGEGHLQWNIWGQFLGTSVGEPGSWTDSSASEVSLNKLQLLPTGCQHQNWGAINKKKCEVTMNMSPMSDHLKWHVLTLAAQRGLCGNSPSKAAAMGNCRFRQGTTTGTEWHTWAGKISAVQLMLGGPEHPNPPWVSCTHRGQLPSGNWQHKQEQGNNSRKRLHFVSKDSMSPH